MVPRPWPAIVGEALRKLLIPVENILISVNPADGAAKTRAVDGGHSV